MSLSLIKNAPKVVAAVLSGLFHTIVGHIMPDMELLWMMWCADRKKDVCGRLDLIPDHHRMFVPSGPMRRFDWEPIFHALWEVGNPNVNAILTEIMTSSEWAAGYVPVSLLRKLRFEFFDVSGDDEAELDQHGSGTKSKFGDDMASIDLMALKADMVVSPEYNHQSAVIRLISRNDRKGTDTSVADPDVDTSDTPNVQRNLRMLITFLNALYPKRPERVAKIVFTAFDAVDTSMAAIFSGMDEEEANSIVTGRKAETAVRKLFLWKNLMTAVEEHFGRIETGTPIDAVLDEDELKAIRLRGRNTYEAKYFRKESMKAFAKGQELWDDAVKDYWDPKKTTTETVITPSGMRLTVVCGTSESPLFGKVARFGNCPLKKRNGGLAYSNRAPRAKADVVVQHRHFDGRGGKFIVSTRGDLYVDEIARAVRERDLVARGYEVEEVHQPLLMERGRQTIPIRKKGSDTYEKVEVLYFAEFGKVVGNSFNTNPYAMRTRLSREAINRIVVSALKRGVNYGWYAQLAVLKLQEDGYVVEDRHWDDLCQGKPSITIAKADGSPREIRTLYNGQLGVEFREAA